MLLSAERHEIVEYGNRMAQRGLTTGSGGNLSVYNRGEGLVAMTPSGMDYCDITPEDVVVLTVGGQVAEGGRRVSSEVDMHLGVYRARPDVCGVVHTHSVYATAVACMGRDLEAVHYMLAMAGTVVKCSKYATYGTRQLAGYALEALGNRGACLLGNHGLLSCAPTLQRAFSTAEHLEFVARLTCITGALGKPNILSREDMLAVMDKFGTSPYR